MRKRIKCNSCGITLEVPRRGEEPYRDIRCQNCSHLLRVTFSDPQPDEQNKTVYGGMKGISMRDTSYDEILTQLPDARQECPGKLRVGSQSFQLHLGRNLVGRKSNSSNADVQIPTDDLQMSREHAVVNIARIADGSLRVLIRNLKGNVSTSVKGMKLEDGDEVVLTNGAELKLGQTLIVYIEE